MRAHMQTNRREFRIQGHPALLLVVYGPDRAHNPLGDGLDQGFYVSRGEVHVSLRELTASEADAVRAHLAANHPEHARLWPAKEQAA